MSALIKKPPSRICDIWNVNFKNVSYIPEFFFYRKLNNIIFNNYCYRTTSDFDQVFENCSDIKAEGESCYNYDYSSDG